MKTIKLTNAAAAALILTLGACKKKTTTTPVPVDTGTVAVTLDHRFGMMNEQIMAIDSTVIHPMSGDTLTFSKFRYFITNVKFKKADGTYWTETESYHLIDLSKPESLKLTFANLPVANYIEMDYTLGVDSARNVSGAQTGDLAVTDDMYWSWNSGYIMLKAEGTYKNNKQDKIFAFHLGGFSGVNNIVTKRTMTFDGSNVLNVTKGNTSTIAIQVNPGLLWHSAPSCKVLDAIHMPGDAAKLMALGQNGDNMGFFTNPLYSFKLMSVK